MMREAGNMNILLVNKLLKAIKKVQKKKKLSNSMMLLKN